jgi:hypothetical protein
MTRLNCARRSIDLLWIRVQRAFSKNDVSSSHCVPFLAHLFDLGSLQLSSSAFFPRSTPMRPRRLDSPCT